MPMPAKTERNNKIVAAYRAGQPIEHIGRDHGVSGYTVRRIIIRAGALADEAERRRRFVEVNRRNQLLPEVRARKAETMRRHWQHNPNMGKPQLFANDPERREEYLLLRDAYGAAYAREAMGLAA